MTAPHVLAAVDFTDASARAVAVAGFIAQVCQGRLSLLHAESIEAPLYFTSEQLDQLERERRASRASGARALEYGRALAARCGGTVFDERGRAIAQVLERTRGTLAVVAAPHPRTVRWTGSYAEPVVRCCAGPVLFIPELSEGATP